jgi:hypothetical protein
LIWPTDWQTNSLFLLRWIHLASGIAWLGMLIAFLLITARVLPEADEATRARVRPVVLPRLLLWMRCSALVAILAGLADYVLLLASEGIWPRVFVFLAAWSFAWFVTAGFLRLSASGKKLVHGSSLAAALLLFFAVVGWSGDLYMRRGGTPKTIALSLGGGLALLMFGNTWVFLAPGNAEGRLGQLAARMNAWLTPVVLFLMGSASHFPLFQARR